jgi:hypothetical protein
VGVEEHNARIEPVEPQPQCKLVGRHRPRFGKGPQHILQLNRPAIHFRHHQDTTTIPTRARTACMSTRRRVDPVREGHPPTRPRPAQGLSSRSRAPMANAKSGRYSAVCAIVAERREQPHEAEAAEGIHGAAPPPTTTAVRWAEGRVLVQFVADDPAIPVAAVTFPWAAKWPWLLSANLRAARAAPWPQVGLLRRSAATEGDHDGPLS